MKGEEEQEQEEKGEVVVVKDRANASFRDSFSFVSSFASSFLKEITRVRLPSLNNIPEKKIKTF